MNPTILISLVELKKGNDGSGKYDLRGDLSHWKCTNPVSFNAIEMY